MPRPVVGIVGAGHVGEATAVRLVKTDVCDVLLSDIVPGLAEGKALDITQSRWIDRHEAGVEAVGGVEEMGECAVLVVAAGIPRKPGMGREQLLDVNAGILKEICGKLKGTGARPILIVVTDPLDVMTYAAGELTGFPRERVLGMAGALDSGRLAHFVAERLKVSVLDVDAVVLGTHGDGMVALPRLTTVSGVPLTELLPADEIGEVIRRAAQGGAEIVNLLKTGSAYYAPASSIAAMVRAILQDTGRVLPCAARLQGEYGMKDLVLGVPCRLGRGGIAEVVELELTEEEEEAFRNSARVVRESLGLLKLQTGGGGDSGSCGAVPRRPP